MSILLALQGAVSQGILWGVMVLGVYITYKLLDIADLTADGSFALGGCVCAVMVVGGHDPIVAILAATAAGIIAGAVTGFLHTVFEIPAILAGILTQIALWSINLRIMGKSNTPLLKLPTIFNNFVEMTGVRQSTASTIIGIIIACFIIILLYWFFGTEMGAAIRATGCNPQMARAQGINTNYTKVLALTISNGLVGLCGGILAQYQGAADVNMGRGAIVIGLAAVIISEVIFGRLCAGKKIAFAYTLAAVFVGAILYYVAYALVLWLKMPSDYMKLFSALVVAVFLAVPYLKGRWAVRRRA